MEQNRTPMTLYFNTTCLDCFDPNTTLYCHSHKLHTLNVGLEVYVLDGLGPIAGEFSVSRTCRHSS